MIVACQALNKTSLPIILDAQVFRCGFVGYCHHGHCSCDHSWGPEPMIPTLDEQAESDVTDGEVPLKPM